MTTKGSTTGFVTMRPNHSHPECRDGHKKVHMEFVIKKQSEYYMCIGTGYLQTTTIHSTLCLNVTV